MKSMKRSDRIKAVVTNRYHQLLRDMTILDFTTPIWEVTSSALRERLQILLVRQSWDNQEERIFITLNELHYRGWADDIEIQTFEELDAPLGSSKLKIAA